MESIAFKTIITNFTQITNDNLAQYYKSAAGITLYEAFEYAIKGGGKRLRPILVLLSAGATGCSPERALGPALAIEILHNFTLLHDDIMDDSPIRHNQPTVCKKWNNDIAILAGDMMMGFAFMAIQHSAEFNASILGRLYKALSHALVKVCEGQDIDVSFNSKKNISMEDYLAMINLKTSVLFCCSAQMGAIAAGASDAVIKALDGYALNLGYAFQIQDDMLDFNAQNVKFGKKLGQDVFEHKKTYPIIKARQFATEQADIEFINNYFDSKLQFAYTDTEVNRFIEIFDRLDIWGIANNEIDKYVALAREQLNTLPHNEYIDYLEMFLDKVVGREY